MGRDDVRVRCKDLSGELSMPFSSPSPAIPPPSPCPTSLSLRRQRPTVRTQSAHARVIPRFCF